MPEHLWQEIICGYRDSYTHFVFTGEGLRLQVPEPGSLILLGSGLVGLVVRGRRRARQGRRSER
jgi:hypothetical protein